MRKKMIDRNLELQKQNYLNYYYTKNKVSSQTSSEKDSNDVSLFGGQFEVRNGIVYDTTIDDNQRELYKNLTNSENNSSPENFVQASSQDYDEQITGTEPASDLRKSLEEAKDKQGILGKAWDGIKNFFGVGSRTDKLEEMVEQAENGEISTAEVEEAISEFEQKQDSVVDIFGNVASGLVAVSSIALAPVTGGASLLVGAAAGGVTNVAVNGLEKGTNEVEDDYSAKDITKDFVTGAVTGTITTVTAGIGTGGNVAATTVKEAAKQGAISGAKSGAIDGSLSNAADYTIDCAFGDDEFNLGELTKSALTGAVVGGTIGATVGGAVGAHQFNKADDIIDVEAREFTDTPELPNNADDTGLSVVEESKATGKAEQTSSNTGKSEQADAGKAEQTSLNTRKSEQADAGKAEQTSSNTGKSEQADAGKAEQTSSNAEKSEQTDAKTNTTQKNNTSESIYASTEFTQADVNREVSEFMRRIQEGGKKEYFKILKELHPDNYGGKTGTFGEEILKRLTSGAAAAAA